ncbi:nucleotide-diphospho-sugar transferase-domain-containing protein [Spinellus fusiger]|nr:nucleotide-diphospho-sugar transferase-domain-containing protein [Spinellus fusiger]
MDYLLRRRTLTVVLSAIFLISLGTMLLQYDGPRESPSSDVFSQDSPAAPPTVSTTASTASSDELVWQPKAFQPPSKSITDIIDSNLRKNQNNNILLTAVANNGMADYTLNWIESLKRCKLDNKYLVFAIDQALVDTMIEKGYGAHVILIPQDWFHQKLDAGFAKWLDKSYTPITHSKTLVVERLLYLNITVWFSDVDIVFTSPYIYNYVNSKLSSRKLTEALFSQEAEQKIVNTGFYLMRPTDLNKKVLHDSIVIQDKTPKVTQQGAINMVLDQVNLSYHDSPIALLDLSLFPQGRLYFELNVPHKYGFEPMMVHANYRIGGEKKQSLQDAGLWYLNKE